MKSLLIAATAALTLGVASQASAADLAARPYTKAPPMIVAAYNWSGFYIGANVGYGWNDRSVGLASAGDPASIAFFGAAFTNGAVPSALSPNAKGVLGGGQIGYNWQWDRIVAGLEADFQGSDVRGTRTVVTTITPAPITTSVSQRFDWFGTVRGRLGVAVDSVLFYGTGGFAYGQVRDAASINAFTLNQFNTQASQTTRSGYAAGAGVEWGFAPNWSIKGEYLYVDLGRHNFATTAGGTTPAGVAAIITDRDQFHTARIGINYRWGGPVVARY